MSPQDDPTGHRGVQDDAPQDEPDASRQPSRGSPSAHERAGRGGNGNSAAQSEPTGYEDESHYGSGVTPDRFGAGQGYGSQSGQAAGQSGQGQTYGGLSGAQDRSAEASPNDASADDEVDERAPAPAASGTSGGKRST